jgi:hypothetical protein
MKRVRDIFVDETDEGHHLVKIFTTDKEKAKEICMQLRNIYQPEFNLFPEGVDEELKP